MIRLGLIKSVEILVSCAIFCINSRTTDWVFYLLQRLGRWLGSLGWLHLASLDVDSGKDWPGSCVVKYLTTKEKK